MHKVGQIVVLNREFHVYLTSSDQFKTEVDGTTFIALTREKLKLIVGKHLKKNHSGIAIPGFIMDEPDIVPITITGIHGGNGNVMYRRNNGPTQQAWANQELFRALDEPNAQLLVSALEMIEYQRKIIQSLCQPITQDEIEDAIRQNSEPL